MTLDYVRTHSSSFHFMSNPLNMIQSSSGSIDNVAGLFLWHPGAGTLHNERQLSCDLRRSQKGR